MYAVELYTTKTGKVPLRKFIDDIQKKYGPTELAKIKTFVVLLQNHGMLINNYHHNAIRQIDGDLYELRPGSNRIFFFYFDDETFVLLHGFRKKQRQTPKNEIETAKSRMEDYKRRHW